MPQQVGAHNGTPLVLARLTSISRSNLFYGKGEGQLHAAPLLFNLYSLLCAASPGNLLTASPGNQPGNVIEISSLIHQQPSENIILLLKLLLSLEPFAWSEVPHALRLGEASQESTGYCIEDRCYIG